MEVIIGFAFGYMVGTRQGREGLMRAVEAAQAISTSDEARRLLEDGVGMLQSLAPDAADFIRKGEGDNGGAVIRDVIDEFVVSRFGRKLPHAA